MTIALVKKRSLLLCAAAGLWATSLAADPAAEALKARIVAHARTISPADYAHTRTARTEQIEGGKTEERVAVERWDPTRGADQRWTLVSIDGRAPTEDELKKHSREAPKRRVAHYDRVGIYFAAPSTVRTDERGRTVFRFQSLPKGSVTIADSDLSANATAEATLNTTGSQPYVAQVRFTSTKSARVKLVAKIERFVLTTRYRMMPEGKPVPAELISDIEGSMLGRDGRVRTVLTYTDHRAVRH